MKKVLVYVDAENVTIEDLLIFQRTIEVELRDDCFMVGKFYGSRKVLGNVFDKCSSMGLDFIDTTYLTGKSKNAADLKIACDCMMDVLTDNDNCRKVYLVSHDRDFLPLIHKLTGCGCTAISPFLERLLEHKTLKDLTALLASQHFEWSVRPRMSDNLFELVRGTAPEDFFDYIVDEYVEQKKIKLERAVRDVLGMESEAIIGIKTRDFGFRSVYKILCHSMPAKEAFTLYTKKIYGYSLSDDEIRLQLRRAGVDEYA